MAENSATKLSPVFSFETRKQVLESLSSESFDLVIVGGGIIGAACARDASLRGIKTLLVEKDDFASGTSSGSSKLIHGGIRYLKNFEFSLVYTAIRERERLESLYAPFVRKMDFVFPTYEKVYPPRWMLNLGLSVYDSFTYFKEHHRSLSRNKTMMEFPQLRSENLSGSMVYTDSFAEDYRLVIEVIKAAHKHGAQCINQVAASFFEERAGGYTVGLHDSWDQKDYKVKTKFALNCSGPFSDQVRALLQIKPSLHLTQGVHFIVLRDAVPLDNAFVLSDPEHDRILFAIPWNGITYLGTTDTDIKDPTKARATKADLDYILTMFKKYFTYQISPDDVLQSWAAVRPLIQPPDSESNSKISREHHIEERPNQFFHVLGGKLTSHREIAKETVDKIAKKMGIRKSCQTAKLPLQDEPYHSARDTHLEKTFGLYAKDVRAYDEERKLERKRITSTHPHLVSEVIYSCHHEMAMSPLDFLRRRSSLYYEKPGKDLVPAIADIMRRELVYTELELDREVNKALKSYEWDLKGFHS